MGRPCKERKIKDIPCKNCFKPANSGKDIEKVSIGIDEFEAIRLSDLEGLSNIKGAEKMKISAPTFNRIVKKAHKKISDAIINQKCIYINCDGEE